MTGPGSTSVTVSSNDYDYYSTTTKPEYAKMVTFQPTVSGYYTFSANCNADSYGCLYDENMNEIMTNDDGNGNSDFQIWYIECEAGKIYYLAAGLYSSSDTAETIEITIIKEA